MKKIYFWQSRSSFTCLLQYLEKYLAPFLQIRWEEKQMLKSVIGYFKTKKKTMTNK